MNTPPAAHVLEAAARRDANDHDEMRREDPGLVVVTGASRGIGRALAGLYRAEGRDVVAVARSTPDADAGCIAVAADLAAPEGVREAARRIAALGRPIDILVHNAGIQLALDFTKPAADEPGDDPDAGIQREMALDLVAPVLLTRALLPLVRRPGGTIVTVTSLVSRQPKASAPVYSAAKAGLASFTLSLRRQLRPVGIRVVEAVPPLVDTEMTAGRGRGKLSAAEMAEAIRDGVAAGRHLVAPGLARRVLVLNRIFPELVRTILARS